jgi:hypothetical protein
MKKTGEEKKFIGGVFSLFALVFFTLAFVFLPPLIATGLAVGVIFLGLKLFK